MLQKLSIQNYAIIDELEIDFNSKMNIVTGETGAGKSIIVGALGLILGERADSSVLINKGKKCVVEGLFLAENREMVKEFFKRNQLDMEEELFIRREINVNGKSRAFINDTPVNLEQLRELSSILVNLHQQFDTLQLGENDFQREVLDALAGHHELLIQYQAVYYEWKTKQKEFEKLKFQKQQFDKEADYNKYQFNELEDAAFKENELETIDSDLKILNNAEGIKSTLSNVYNELKENENPVSQQLKILLSQLQNYSSYHPGLPALVQRLQSAQLEIQDVADELNDISYGINYDPQKIEELNDRLTVGYKLLKKHGVQTTNDLILIHNQLEEKLQAVMNMDDAIQEVEKELEENRDQALSLAKKISEGRNKETKSLQEKINKLLAQVGMPNAKLRVATGDAPSLNEYGTDIIDFLFDANLPAAEAGRSGQFLPLRKVASGGELSRLMLCIKSLVAQKIDLPTMIFDEIDTGISGEAARQVGIIMKELAGKRQVISITHQPQIAGKADAHFFVYKEIIKDSVKTNIRLLTTEERITTIAKMLSGEKPTAAAIENAREMVMN